MSLQVGTVRYMSPEALEARVNLHDIASFKQIDVYALSMVMWEVLSRCCVLSCESHDTRTVSACMHAESAVCLCVCLAEEVGAYQLPYAELVAHPTLEAMKDIVCMRQLRPPIPSLWSNQEVRFREVASFQEVHPPFHSICPPLIPFHLSTPPFHSMF